MSKQNGQLIFNQIVGCAYFTTQRKGKIMFITEFENMFDKAVDEGIAVLIILIDPVKHVVEKFWFKGDLYTDIKRLPVHFRMLVGIVANI